MSAQPFPILTIGDPRLEQIAAPVALPDPGLESLLDRLHATLDDFRRRRGFGRALAAPQVGIGRRIIVMNLGAGRLTLLDPEITWRSAQEFEVWDDCLSVPASVVRVKRHASVSLRYRDQAGRQRHWLRLPPDLAELIQHEVDHLEGILMTRRAWGPDAVRPIAEHAQLVGAGRPKPRLSLERIAAAARAIDPVFRGSPQYECESLSEALGCRLTLKVETVNPVRSFKGRGADFFLHQAEARGDGRALVCASAGNWGPALAYAARRHGRGLVVFTARNAEAGNLDLRVRRLGDAEVRLAGDDFEAARLAAAEFAASSRACMVECGREPEISEGAGSLAVELFDPDPAFDAVLLPLGHGALLNGVARWTKAASPATRVIGVCAAGADAMRRSFEGGAVIEGECDSARTIAAPLAVRVPIPEAVADMRGMVDQVLSVTDAQMLDAMRLVERHAGLSIEPAGAAGVAALAACREEFEGRRVATVLSGGNLTGEQGRRWIL